MTVERRLKNNTATIDTSLQVARERLLKAVNDGSSGVVIIKVAFNNGGVRNLTVGDEMVIDTSSANGE